MPIEERYQRIASSFTAESRVNLLNSVDVPPGVELGRNWPTGFTAVCCIFGDPPRLAEPPPSMVGGTARSSAVVTTVMNVAVESIVGRGR